MGKEINEVFTWPELQEGWGDSHILLNWEGAGWYVCMGREGYVEWTGLHYYNRDGTSLLPNTYDRVEDEPFGRQAHWLDFPEEIVA